MSRICDLCGKTYQKGKKVSRGIGNRVTRRTIKRSYPNLKTVRVEVNGKMKRMKLCTKCLKSTRLVEEKK